MTSPAGAGIVGWGQSDPRLRARPGRKGDGGSDRRSHQNFQGIGRGAFKKSVSDTAWEMEEKGMKALRAEKRGDGMYLLFTSAAPE